MTTYTTKIATNGYTVLYYSTETGKRIAKKTALENERNYIISNGTRAARYDLAVDAVNFEPWASDGTCGLWKVWVIRDGLGRFESNGDRDAQQKLAEFNLTLNDFANEQHARRGRQR